MNQVSKFKRFTANIIDVVVAYFPLMLLLMFHSIILILLGELIAVAIYLVRDAMFGGQSIGKKIMRYKAVNADGTSLAGDFNTSAIRNISLLIPFVDAIKVLKDQPRLGDGWANTKVIQA